MMNSSLFDYAGGIQLFGGLESAVTLPVILAGICLIGCAGNFTIFVVLVHNFRNGKASIINTLLINLNTIDLLIVTLCVPVRAVTYSRQWWTLGAFVCKTADWFQHCCLVAKSFTLAAISQVRYNECLNPHKFVNFDRRIAGAIIFIWIASLVLTIPHIIFTTTVQYKAIELCVFEVPLYAANFMNVFSKIYPMAAYVIPVIYTVTFYSKEILRAKQRVNKAQNARQQNTRLTLTLICVSSIHALMWLPELSAWVWARHSKNNASKPDTVFLIFAQVILYIGSSVNPIVFFGMSEDFRGGLSSVWTSITRKAHRPPEDTRSQKTGENGVEVVDSVINSLQDLKAASPPDDNDAPCPDASGSSLPDVKHFWQERRNTTAGEEHDPVPWESENKK